MNELYSVDGQIYEVSPENKEKFLNDFPGAELFQERSGVEVDMTEPDQVIMEQTEFATDMLDSEDMSVDEARAYLENKGISIFGTPDQQLERKYRDQLVSKEGRQELFGVDLNKNLGQRIQNAEYLATLEKEKRGFVKAPEDKGFFEDIMQAAKEGTTAGSSVNEAFDVYKHGANITDEKLDAYIEAAAKMEEIGPTNEQYEFTKAQTRYGGGIFGTLKALNENPGFFPQLLVSSIATMGSSMLDSEEVAGTSLASAGIGASAGFTMGSLGYSFGPVGALTQAGGAVTGAFSGGIGGLVGAMETGLTLTDLLKTELDGKEFNKENIRGILEDDDAVERIKNASLKRGLTIGAVEGLTAGLSRGVGSSLLKSGASPTKIAAKTGVIEMTGGGVGELGGQIATKEITGPVDLGEVTLEAVAEVKGVANVSDIVFRSLNKSQYSVNGEKRTKQEVKDIVESKNIKADELAKIKFSVTNDKNFNNFVKEKQNDAILETQINERVSDINDRKQLVDLEKQRIQAEIDSKKTGIQKIPGSEQRLQTINAQIDAVVDKYSGVDARTSEVRGRKKAAEQVREAVVQQNFEANIEFAKKHSGLYNLEINDKLTRQEILEKYGKQAAKSNGFIKGNQIIINSEVARTKGIEGANVGNHELLHGIIKSSGLDIKQNLITDFLNIIGTDNEAIVQQRISDNYSAEYMKSNPDEYFTIFSDAIETGDIKFNDGVFTKIKDVVRRLFQDLGIVKVNFDNIDAKGVYNFLKDYNRSIHKGALSSGIVKATKGEGAVEGIKFSLTAGEMKTLDKKEVDEIKAEIGDDIKALVPEGTTKQEYDRTVIGKVYTDLVQGNTLDRLIDKQLAKNAVVGDNVFGKSKKIFIQRVKDRLFEGTLLRFNPEINDDLGGFVISELVNFRIGDVYNEYESATGGGSVGSLDIPVGETGSIRTPVADEAVDIQTTEAPRSELKQGLRVDGEQFVDEALDTELQTNTLEIIEGVTPEIDSKDLITYLKDASQQKSFKTIKNKLKNLNEVLEDNYKVLFHGKNLPIATLVALERQLPVEERIFTGEPTRLTTQAQIDKAIDEGDFHVENEKQGPMKYPRKKPTIEQVLKFANPPAINPKTGKPSGLKGTRKDGIVNAIAFSLFRDYAPETMNRANIDARDIAKVAQRLIVDPTIKFSVTKAKENASKTNFVGKKGIDDIVNKNMPNGIIKNKKEQVSYTKNTIENFNEKTGLPTVIFLKSTNLVTGNKASTAIKRNILGVNKLQNTNRGVVNKKITEKNIKAETDGLIFEFSKAAKIGKINSKEINPLTNEVFTDQELNDLSNFNRSKTRANESKNIQEIESIKRGEKLFLNILQKKYNEDNSIIQFISEFLYNSDLNSNTGRNAAALIGKEEGVGPANRTEEHTYQANNWARRTLQAITSGDKKILNGWADWSAKNYYQITIQKKTDDKLNLTYNVDGVKYKSKSEEHPLLKKSLDEAFKTGDFSNVLSSDVRYFNPNVYINANTTSFMGESFAKKYNVEVDNKYKTNEDVALFQADLIYRQITDNNFTPDKAKKELNVYMDNLAPSIAKLPKKNKTKYSNSTSNNGLLNDLNNHDKALRNARNLNAPKKGISIFDFDDTLATSKSKVIVTMPDGSIKKITPSEFAKQHNSLEQKNAEFDFSEFNKVVDGKPGPLVAKIKKAIDKFGNKDVFILTARPQASAVSIKAFLDGIGINVPLENITGLENGTPQAKANWVIGKASEGYNDFYFTDDVYKNVKAVQDALEVLDVKSKTRLAYSDRVKKLDRDFNDIIEAKTGIAAEKEYGRAKAQVVGANKGKFKFFIPPSAEDFVGLLYKTLAKGKLGDSQMAWYKKNLLDPYASAMAAISRERIALMDDYKALKKQLGVVPKNLRKKIQGEEFTNEQALRVYIWNKQGMDVPGLSKTDLKELTDYIESKPNLKVFGDQLISINKADGYTAPTSSWLGGTITTDLLRGLGTTKRVKHLEQWQQNVDIIFSEKNLNKLEAANGKPYRTALEGILQRMKTGRNRSFSGDSLTGKITDWLTNSIGTIMFFNTRSALLQTISAVNFVNFSDNNIFKAGKAFGNQKQFWSDFMTLMNSEFLIDRRRGLRINVNEADIANMASQGGARGVVAKILEVGFLPTQIADSFAIASGGASFYRNRINTYKKQGLSDQQAQEKAFNDFREIAEESQQSSRPDRISQQQAGPLGRIILAFANTPMQYARLIKKAASDLKNNRGDVKTNISKLIYYSFVQNIAFNAMQQALFAIGFGDEEDEEDANEKYINTANGMVDSLLRGVGVAGAFTSAGKNIINRVIKESQKDNPKYEKISFELARVSPPISSKLSRLNQAGRAFQWEKDEMIEKGFAIDNPALMAGANVISAATNIPIDRLVRKANNVNTALSQDLQLWERLALFGGWQDWEIGVDDKQKIKSKKKRTFGTTIEF